MSEHSLRRRLLFGAVVAILAALVLAWLFMTLLFERHLEDRVQAEMTRDGLRLVAGLSLAADARPVVLRPPDDSRLEQPAGGYYWEVSAARGAVRSRSLWDADLPSDAAVAASAWHRSHVAGPYGSRLVMVSRRIELTGGGDVLVQLAQNVAPVSAARDEFGRELALFLGALWLALSAAAWLQVRLGLQPLRRLPAVLAGLRERPTARLPSSGVREVRPLVDSINALADARARDLDVARRRAADLAHSLKTPLAAMTAQSRHAREAGATAAADGLDRAIAAMRQTVDRELARARIAAVHASAGAGDGALLLETVERLVLVLEHTDKGGTIAFELDLPESLRVPLQVADLSELLGALLENAVCYARRRVAIRARLDSAGSVMNIEDDGPGIDDAAAQRVLLRGGRLDQHDSGSGLGLAIARELVAASGGCIRLTRSTLGGLCVTLIWPP